ncbi:hypothetical protein SK128_022184, partial [Halocaridina rubra]
MVGPHTTGQLVRSLVRVPGSGHEREAMPSFLDLSKVSSLAATVHVPRSLPKELVKNYQPSSTEDFSSTAKFQGNIKLENKDFVQGQNTIQDPSPKKATGQKRPCPGNLEKGAYMTPSSGVTKAARLVVQVTSGSACTVSRQLYIPVGNSISLQTQTSNTSSAVAVQPAVILKQTSVPTSSSVSSAEVVQPAVLLQNNYLTIVESDQVNSVLPQKAIRSQQLPRTVVSNTPVQSSQMAQSPQGFVIVSQHMPQIVSGTSAKSAVQMKTLIAHVNEERNRLQAENKVLLQKLH